MTQTVNRRPLAAEGRVWSRISAWEIYGLQSGTGTRLLFFYSEYSAFSSVIIIPPVPHTYLHLHFAVTRKTSGLSLGTFQNRCSFGDRGEIDRKIFFSLFRPVRQIAKKRLLASSCLPVRPSAWSNSATTGQVFIHCCIWVFFEIVLGKLNFHYNPKIMTGTFTWRPI